MSNRPVALPKCEILPSKKVRWKKMYRKNKWISSAYPSDSRRSRAEAWSEYLIWEQRIDDAIDAATQDQLGQQTAQVQMTDHLIANLQSGLRQLGHTQRASQLDQVRATLPHTDSSIISSLLDLMMIEVKNGNYETREKMKVIDPTVARTTSDALGTIAQKYIDTQRKRAEAKQISIGHYGKIKSHVPKFVKWWGEDRSLSSFDNQSSVELYEHCLTMCETRSQNTVSDAHAEIKAFIENCGREGYLTVPANLRDKFYHIPRVSVEPDLFTIDEIKILTDEASEKTKLYLLLMLNCGMYQGDISELTSDQVDWEHGRIIRNRSKKNNKLKKKTTKRNAKDNRINWLLWDETFNLLKKYGSREGLVLTNEQGQPLVRETIKPDGTTSKTDAFHSAWNRLKVKCKNRKKLPKDWSRDAMQLRKVGANIIRESAYAEFYEMFLDHSSMSNRAYLVGGKPIAKFDEAIIFFGNAINFETIRTI